MSVQLYKHNLHNLNKARQLFVKEPFRTILLAYPTTAYFQWGLLKNDPYTNTVNVENGRVF